jgi:hypothetical protein
MRVKLCEKPEFAETTIDQGQRPLEQLDMGAPLVQQFSITQVRDQHTLELREDREL